MAAQKISVIVDGNAFMNVFYRATLPEAAKKSENPDSPDFFPLMKRNSMGAYISAVRLFIQYVTILVNTYHPVQFAVAFDVPGGSQFRKDAYPAYKGTRGEKPAPLLEQIDTCQFWLRKCGIPVYTNNQCEADDIIASLSSKLAARSDRVIIVTTDHDYYQMVNDKVMALMYIPNQKKFEAMKQKYPTCCIKERKLCLYTAKMIKEETGVHPYQIPDLKGLCGDVSDNIPKVPGVGDKTAIQLLTMYPSVELLIEAVETHSTENLTEIWNEYPGVKIRGAAKIIDSIRENSQTLKLSKWLATTWFTVPVPDCPSLNVDMNAWMELQRFITEA